MTGQGPNILLLDTEVAPLLGYAWDMYDTRILKVLEDKHFLAVGWMWLENRKAECLGLDDFDDYNSNVVDDRNLTEHLWNLLDEADIVIAHNTAFDIKLANARFIYHGMRPPSSYKSRCTLKMARTEAKFTSNKLDDLAKHLGIGRKLVHTGFDLWDRCMSGDPAAWRKLKAYCKKDVRLLQEIYKILRPWDKGHPSVAVFRNDDCCPVCGHTVYQKRGVCHTNTYTYQRYVCQNPKCGANFRDRLSDKEARKPAFVKVG